ncbi:hypothetical protein IIA79_01090 [bacterium]|nr:hypothetical protein [bacterium]
MAEYARSADILELVLAPLSVVFIVLGTALRFVFLVRSSSRERLAKSDLAVRLASGWIEQDAIFEHTPWPWRYLLPRGQADELMPRLSRIAGNLDWYLGKPRRLFRPYWIYLIIWWIIFGAEFAGFMHPCTIDFVLASLLGVLPIAFIQVRRQIWTQEFLRYLHAHLAE